MRTDLNESTATTERTAEMDPKTVQSVTAGETANQAMIDRDGKETRIYLHEPVLTKQEIAAAFEEQRIYKARKALAEVYLVGSDLDI